MKKCKKIIDSFFSDSLSFILSIVAFSCILISIIVFFVWGNWTFSWVLNEEKVGQFGDFIGGVVGTILAFVAAILYYVALREQRKDIRINQKVADLQYRALLKQIEEFEKQKEELELTRKVYEQQSRTMAQQERIMQQQQFENTFFNMLSLQQEIVNNLSFKSISIKQEDDGTSKEMDDAIKGREIFEIMYATSKLNIIYDKELFLRCKELEEDLIYMQYLYHHDHLICVHGGIKNILQFFSMKGYEYTNELPLFDHYFRHLYRILKFIDESNLDFDNKYKYTSILRATLSPYELVWIFYNCLSEYGYEKFKPLLEEYSILKNLRFSLLTETVDFTNEDIKGANYNTGEYLYKYYSTKTKGIPDKYYLQAYYKKDSIDLNNAIKTF